MQLADLQMWSILKQLAGFQNTLFKFTNDNLSVFGYSLDAADVGTSSSGSAGAELKLSPSRFDALPQTYDIRQ